MRWTDDAMNAHFHSAPDHFGTYFPFLFVGMWIFVSYVLAWQSGWARLARCYRAAEGGVYQFAFSSGRLGGVGYSSSLNIGADARGLHISAVVLFRLWHAPLCVPWSDIRATLGKRWSRQIVILEFQREPFYALEITAELAAKLAAVPGASFKVPE